MRLFTWYDIELELKKRRSIWPVWWNRVDAYSDEIVININADRNDGKENERVLGEIFGKLYQNGGILVEFDQIGRASCRDRVSAVV